MDDFKKRIENPEEYDKIAKFTEWLSNERLKWKNKSHGSGSSYNHAYYQAVERICVKLKTTLK